MTTLRSIGDPVALLRPYRGRLLGLLLILLAAACAEAVGLAMLAALLNLLVNAKSPPQGTSFLVPLYAYAKANSVMFLLMLCLTYVGKSLLALWANYVSFSLALLMTDDWRIKLVRGFLRTPLASLNKKQGAMLQLVLDEPTVVALGLGAAGLLAQNMFSTLTVYAMLLYLSPLVTIGLTVIALTALVAVGFLSRYSHRVAVQRSEVFSDGYAYMTEMLGAIKQLRLFNLESNAEIQTARHFDQMRKLQHTANFVASSPRLLIEMIFLFGFAVVLIAFMARMNEGIVVSALGLAVAAAIRVLPTFSASASTWVHLHQAWPAMVKIAKELSRLEMPAVGGAEQSSQAVVEFYDRIVVQDIRFAYPGREEVLSGVSLEIPSGTVTAIVGQSGSGKSTLIDLLCGFLQPTGGAITVDGVDLSKVSIKQWREQLGVVSQDGFLFSGTVRDNLCLLRPACPEPWLQQVIELVGAADFIKSLPHGYETRVGERGLTMSGGQRQRLALARVLIKEPRVLIMDEATSALDVESEEVLQAGLERLRGRMTMIIIAHRLSTVRRADRIYVLESGKVVESGGHDDLIARGGPYAAAMRRTTEMGVAG